MDHLTSSFSHHVPIIPHDFSHQLPDVVPSCSPWFFHHVLHVFRSFSHTFPSCSPCFSIIFPSFLHPFAIVPSKSLHQDSSGGGPPPKPWPSRCQTLGTHGDVKRWSTTLSGWWARATPLKNMSSSIGMISNPIYGKIKNGNQTTNQLLYTFITSNTTQEIRLKHEHTSWWNHMWSIFVGGIYWTFRSAWRLLNIADLWLIYGQSANNLDREWFVMRSPSRYKSDHLGDLRNLSLKSIRAS